jgi:hypothetical protein
MLSLQPLSPCWCVLHVRAAPATAGERLAASLASDRTEGGPVARRVSVQFRLACQLKPSLENTDARKHRRSTTPSLKNSVQFTTRTTLGPCGPMAGARPAPIYCCSPRVMLQNHVAIQHKFWLFCHVVRLVRLALRDLTAALVASRASQFLPQPQPQKMRIRCQMRPYIRSSCLPLSRYQYPPGHPVGP